jgi:hypothetical protein
VVRALLLAAVRAFGRIAGDQRIMGAAHVPLGAGNSILWDSHVTTSVSLGGMAPVKSGSCSRFSRPLTRFRVPCPTDLSRRPGTYCDSVAAQVLSGWFVSIAALLRNCFGVQPSPRSNSSDGSPVAASPRLDW